MWINCSGDPERRKAYINHGTDLLVSVTGSTSNIGTIAGVTGRACTKNRTRVRFLVQAEEKIVTLAGLITYYAVK
ncbi:hypothetical protein [Desulfosporosinus nitroreducens]|uniref:hypothetical protein n=1 Tax=Desulfosporosinus nitroreducens TaxID=2018668 RepID=UPI00207C3A02|nr:hypothetical protein [Desulfosporosinus nitroreducens]MCO1602027.1 hypothetical protein [Desulfosporosinus nitroreducens]